MLRPLSQHETNGYSLYTLQSHISDAMSNQKSEPVEATTTQEHIQAEDENKEVDGKTVETDAICAFD